MYQHNVFHVLIRDNIPTWRFEQCLFPIHLPLFRNVVIECMKDSWKEKWLANIATCIETLIQNNMILQSLTLVIVLEILTLTNPITGAVGNMTTFAHFFAKGSKVMKSLMRLQCRVFNLVIKLKGGTKVVVSRDASHLECNYARSLSASDQARRQNCEDDEGEKRS